MKTQRESVGSLSASHMDRLWKASRALVRLEADNQQGSARPADRVRSPRLPHPALT
jgi:hypothetical protein